MLRNKIIVAHDGSPGAVRAARWALGEASRTGAPVEFCHVWDHPGPAHDPAVRRAEDDLEQAALDAAVSHPRVPVTTVLDRGPCAAVLAGRTAGAGLLVVGCSTTADDGAPLGATAAAVSEETQCPVVVIRGEPGHEPVLVGVDDAEEAGPLLAFGFEQAAAYGTTLHAVTAWLPACPRSRWPVPGETLDGRWRALTTLVERRREQFPTVKATHEVVVALPADALLARAEQAGLVVVGSRARRPTALGSVSRHLLRHARTSVAVIRAAP